MFPAAVGEIIVLQVLYTLLLLAQTATPALGLDLLTEQIPAGSIEVLFATRMQ